MYIHFEEDDSPSGKDFSLFFFHVGTLKFFLAEFGTYSIDIKFIYLVSKEAGSVEVQNKIYGEFLKNLKQQT